MKRFIIAALFGLLFTNASRSATIPEAPSYVFQIPVYPETELFKGNPSLNQLMPPLATEVKIYRTRGGKSLDAEAVIAYYREQFMHKGWKEGVFKRQTTEPYLGLMTQVYENLPDGTAIQANGQFYLWVAPKDGMFTIYMQQHRISRIDQATRKALSDVAESLKRAATEVGYDALTVYSDSGWETDYENEYLVDRQLFSLVATQFRAQAHSDPSKSIEVSLRTFKDGAIARIEQANEQKALSERSGYGIAIAAGKLVIRLYDQSGKQARPLDEIAKAVIPSR